MATLLDILLGAAVAALAVRAVWQLRKDRKKGCRGGCSCCPMAGQCEKREDKRK